MLRILLLVVALLTAPLFSVAQTQDTGANSFAKGQKWVAKHQGGDVTIDVTSLGSTGSGSAIVFVRAWGSTPIVGNATHNSSFKTTSQNEVEIYYWNGKLQADVFRFKGVFRDGKLMVPAGATYFNGSKTYTAEAMEFTLK